MKATFPKHSCIRVSDVVRCVILEKFEHSSASMSRPTSYQQLPSLQVDARIDMGSCNDRRMAILDKVVSDRVTHLVMGTGAKGHVLSRSASFSNSHKFEKDVFPRIVTNSAVSARSRRNELPTSLVWLDLSQWLISSAKRPPALLSIWSSRGHFSRA